MESVIGVVEGKDETEKIEILMERDEDQEARLHLRSLSWGEGIGWYPQKTIILNCDEIGKLQTILNQVKAISKTKPRRSLRSRGKIVPFPRRHQTLQTVERRELKEA